METSTIFITAFLVGLSGAMMPGPLLTATIAISAQRGFAAGFYIALGHVILELFLLFALLAGLSAVLTLAAVTRIIAIVGGGFLIYLGLSMIRNVMAGRISLSRLEQSSSPSKLMNPLLAGIAISISSPFWSVWWATVGLSYLILALKSGMIGVGAFYTGHILSDLAWYSLVAAVIAGGRRVLSQRVYDTILILCGLFLLGLGIYFLYTGITMH